MKKEIIIEGMTCNHCKMRVEKALSEVEGVTSAEVVLAEKKAIVEVSEAVANNALTEAVDEAGYDVVEVK